MKKNIFIVVLAFFFTAPIIASTPAAPSAGLSKKALLEKLVTDKNFQALSFAGYTLGEKLTSKTTTILLSKYLKKQASPQEIKTLLHTMNLNAESEINGIFAQLSAASEKVNASFPELTKDQSLKSVVKAAALQVAVDLKFDKNQKKVFFNCWTELVAYSAWCSQNCYGNSDCVNNCYSAALEEYILCSISEP